MYGRIIGLRTMKGDDINYNEDKNNYNTFTGAFKKLT
jgi:hypothetical protein